MTLQEAAGNIVKEILDDLASRKGLENEWEEIDEEIQHEIITEWESIAVDILMVLGDTNNAVRELIRAEKAEAMLTTSQAECNLLRARVELLTKGTDNEL